MRFIVIEDMDEGDTKDGRMLVVYSPFGYDTFRIRRANGGANGVGGATELPSPSSTVSFLTLLSRNDWYNVSTSRAEIR